MEQMDEFNITPKGVLKAYSGKEKIVQIPEGVTEIGARAFETAEITEVRLPDTLRKIGKSAFQCSKLEKIAVPAGVTEIGENAFWCCSKLKEVNIEDPQSIRIGANAFAGCDSLADKSGVFVLQSRLFCISSNKKDPYIIIPDGVTKIESDTFFFFRKHVFHLEMSVHCPSWEWIYERPGFLVEQSGSSITFRDAEGKKVARVVLAYKDETGPKREAAVSVMSSRGGKFNFAKYDENFANLTKEYNKIRVALARLEYPYELSEEFLEVYQYYVKKRAVTAGMLLIDEDDPEMLARLGEKKMFTAGTVAKLIEYAKTKNRADITGWLLDYKNSVCGRTKAKSAFKLNALEEIPALESSAQEKSIAEWRKIYSFKYKDGGVVITGYLGSDACVTFPEKIGNRYVIGLGSDVFNPRTSKKVKKIIVPGWIKSIETAAFDLIERKEVEIQEGVTELQNAAFCLVNRLTIKLPASLTEIGEQFGDFEDSNTLIVPENSCAEEFCKKHKLRYTIYKPEPAGAAGNTAASSGRTERKTPEQKTVKPWKRPKAGTHKVSRYAGKDTAVEFPTSVDGIKITGIADTAGDAPANYKAIRSVVIPEGYTYIGTKAFFGCENLETISLPTTLKEIGTKAFAGCRHLKEIVIRKNMKFIGNDTFADSDIDTVVMETEENMTIPMHFFFGCRINKFVVVGGPFVCSGNVFDYTGATFGVEYAKKMYAGNFPKEVYINGNFSTLDLKGAGGGNIRKIHPLADFDETGVIDADAKSLIAEEKKKNSRVVDNAGKAVETISVEHIDFPNSVFVLAGFSGKEQEKVRAEISQRGGKIGSKVSEKCNYLVVPDRDILKTARMEQTIELQKQGKAIAIIRLEECRRHMNISDVALFGEEGAKIASEYRLSLIDGCITLHAYLGDDEDIIIPERIGDYPVTALAEGCFSEGYGTLHSSQIRSIVIPGTIRVLPRKVCYYCRELKTVTLSEGLTKIERDAFDYCEKLESVNIPNSTAVIERHAFCSCEALKKLVVGSENPVYESREKCSSVIETKTNTLVIGCKTTVIPSSLTAIGDYAFDDRYVGKTLEIPEGVTEIGVCAFRSAKHLKTVRLPESLVRIGDYAFSYCRALSEVFVPDSLAEVGSGVFYDCHVKKVSGSKNSLAEKIAEEYHAEYVEI